jgi:hypothetical protein
MKYYKCKIKTKEKRNEKKIRGRKWKPKYGKDAKEKESSLSLLTFLCCLDSITFPN